MSGGELGAIEVWAKHLEDFVQEIHNKVDKDNPLYQDMVNLLDSVKCLPDWIRYDRRARERLYQNDNLDK